MNARRPRRRSVGSYCTTGMLPLRTFRSDDPGRALTSWRHGRWGAASRRGSLSVGWKEHA